MTNLPALIDPLTPADSDLRAYEFMPLSVLRLRDAKIVREIGPEAFRAAMLLWCAAWHQVPSASLPDDDKELASLAGYGYVVAAWKAIRDEALYGFIKCADGRFYHPVIAEKANEAWEKRRFYIERSRVANSVRHDPNKPKKKLVKSRSSKKEALQEKPALEPALSLKDSLIEQRGEDRDRTEDTPKGVGKPERSTAAPRAAPKMQRGSRLPFGWSPNVKLRQFAAEHGFSDQEMWAMVDEFTDWWKAAPGQKGVKLDWDATWRTWVRSQAKRRGGGHGRSGNGAPTGSGSPRRSAGGGGGAEARIGNMLAGAMAAVDRRR